MKTTNTTVNMKMKKHTDNRKLAHANGSATGKNGDFLRHIYELGGKVVLLPMPRGCKHPKGREAMSWQKTTFEQTRTPLYQHRLKEAEARGGNIGILLGPQSDNIITLDFDLPAEIEPFLSKHPFARKTMRTVGARGCQLWFRMKGDYPKNKFDIYSEVNSVTGKKEAIEFRTSNGETGIQSVCFGEHSDEDGKPDGILYRFDVDRSPLEITYSQISGWVDSFKARVEVDSDDEQSANADTITNNRKDPNEDFAWWCTNFPDLDLKDLNLKGLLEAGGVSLIRNIKRVEGQDWESYYFECPWEREHSTANKWTDMELRQWPVGSRRPTTLCQHHCREKRNRIAVVQWLVEKRGVPIATIKKFCQPPAIKLPPIEKADGTEKPELPPELIRGVLHQGLKMMIAGSSKEKKTWLVMDLAVALATGGDWLGRPTQQTNVLFLNFEVPKEFYLDRLYQVRVNRKLKTIDNFSIWNLRGYDVSGEKTWDELIKRAERHGPFGVIVIDPIYKLYGEKRDENKTTDMAGVMRGIDRLAEAMKAAAIVVHHFSKGNQAEKEARDRAGGSGVFARDVDVNVTMTKLVPPGEMRMEIEARNVEPIPLFAVKWKYPAWERDPECDHLDLYKPSRGGKQKLKVNEKQYHTYQILDVLPKEGLIVAQWMIKALEFNPGMSERTFYNLLKEVRGIEPPPIKSVMEGKAKRYFPVKTK